MIALSCLQQVLTKSEKAGKNSRRCSTESFQRASSIRSVRLTTHPPWLLDHSSFSFGYLYRNVCVRRSPSQSVRLCVCVRCSAALGNSGFSCRSLRNAVIRRRQTQQRLRVTAVEQVLLLLLLNSISEFVIKRSGPRPKLDHCRRAKGPQTSPFTSRLRAQRNENGCEGNVHHNGNSFLLLVLLLNLLILNYVSQERLIQKRFTDACRLTRRYDTGETRLLPIERVPVTV